MAVPQRVELNMSLLFQPLQLRGVKFPNRAWTSPMCQYSARDGLANSWHEVHLGSRAVGGAGLVMTEATAVSPEGRISAQDLGLWSDRQAEALAPIAAFITSQESVPGIQLAHAGRKASVEPPWLGGGALLTGDAWDRLGPSPIPFGDLPCPLEMSQQDMDLVKEQFVAAASRASQAGFKVLELHLAHGYLLHSFLSPLSNRRQDPFGGTLQERARFPLQVIESVREVWPEKLPLFARISATDWADERGGFTIAEAVAVSKWMASRGVDLVDCSSGGLIPDVAIATGPGYQVPFSGQIRAEAVVSTAAVGMLSDPQRAEKVLASGDADAIFVARGMLADPYWALHAASSLGDKPRFPQQYGRIREVNLD